MRKPLVLALLFSLACVSGSIQSGRTSGASTDDFEVKIEQSNEPMSMPTHDSADVKFLITVKNYTAEPWTIKSIALQSMGGGMYRMPVRTRGFDRLVEPSAEARFEFWGTVEIADDPALVRAPITMRAKLFATNGEVNREEEFMEKINGKVSVAVR